MIVFEASQWLIPAPNLKLLLNELVSEIEEKEGKKKQS